MAKLTRYLQKIFANNSNQVGVFGTGVDKETSKNVETLQSADYENGWSSAIITNKNYPIWQELDGVQYGFSYQLAYLMQNGIPEWLSTETYYQNSYCRVGSTIYYSLQDNNIGHNPTLNDGYWSPLLTSNRYIGEIVTSTIPLTDAGLHLLDGALLQYGSYKAYIDYMADLYEDNPTANYFAQPLPEQDWIQPVLSSNGVLGGNTFACSADSVYNDFYAYKALDGNTSTSWQSNGTTSSGTWFIFYNPIPLKVTQITWSGTPTYGTITGGVVYGSNDNSNYTQIGTFSNGTTTGGTIDLSTNTNFYKYYKITPTTWTDTTGTLTNGWAKLSIVAKTQSRTAEEVWQDTVARYGSCGKFVYDSVNNTIRLPKISDILQGTTDVTALGDLIEAGLPNIKTSSSVTRGLGISDDSTIDPPFYYIDNIGTEAGGSQATRGVGFDASLSNPIYGNSPTVQPQTILGLIYIVIATSTKTQIQVDIDEVMTDLNGKADRDLSNTVPAISFATAMNTAGIRTVVETYRNGSSWYRVWSDGWCEQGGQVTISTNTTITLLKPYNDTNYNLLNTINNDYQINTDACTWSSASAYRISASQIRLNYSSGGTIRTWQACGYIS